MRARLFAALLLAAPLFCLPGFVSAQSDADKAIEALDQAMGQAKTSAPQGKTTSAQPPYRRNVGVESDTDRPGGDYVDFDLPSARYELCRDACARDANCRAYTYVKPGIQGPNARCWLKSSVPPAASRDCCVSGVEISQ
ncbi:MAG: PAN domain-containing protein [Desulfovibrionaceae bacterium]|nr:PAN domain-containing protein [Desulfovibrionaceae bacterium]MBF0512848.1 PAN domain-containing protein [Desulfovibrionaceae bacterium]